MKEGRKIKKKWRNKEEENKSDKRKKLEDMKKRMTEKT